MARRIGSLILAAFCVAGSGAAARAQATLPPDVAQASTDWAACRAQSLQAGLKGSRTAEALADAALAACQPQQDKLSDLAIKAFGPSAADSLVKARENARKEAITAINEARNGRSFSDPRAAWGECIGEQAGKGVAGRDPAGLIADRALDACKSQEKAVLAALQSQNGQEQAAKEVEADRKVAHDQIASMVEAARARAR